MELTPPLPLDHLLDPRRLESSQVEFKSDWTEQTRPAILRTLCALANDLPNHNGGRILIGVREEGGRPLLPPPGLDIGRLEQIQKELRESVKSWITPDYLPVLYQHPVGAGRAVLEVRCPAGDARPYRCRSGKGERGEQRVPYVRTSDSTQEAQGEVLRHLEELSRRVPFDAQTAFDLQVEDLSSDRVREHLVAARSRLAGPEHSLADRLRGMDLSRRVNGHEAPLHAAVLFFSEDPSRRYRGARVEIVRVSQGGDRLDEQTLTGPLPYLVRESLRVISAHNPERVQKRADRAEADRTLAWPGAAIEEAVVNAVCHRGYDGPEDPIQIELHPDRLIIHSYPGPVPGLSREALQRGELVRPPARNRRVAELLKELGLAEARSTGLGKIRAAMAANGNPAPSFSFDEERTWFRVDLPIHPELRAPPPQAAAPAQPLRLGRPAPPDEVIGRDALVAAIWQRLERRDVLLLGPPGRGISSVLGLLAARAPAGRPTFHLAMAGVTASGLDAALREWCVAQGWTVPDLEGTGPGGGAEATLSALQATGPSRDGLTLALDDVSVRRPADGNPLRTLLAGRGDTPRLVLAGLDAPFPRGRLDAADRVVVPPLAPQAAAELARRLLRGAHREDLLDQAEALGRLSRGNPTVIGALVECFVLDDLGGADALAHAWDRLLLSPDPRHLLGPRDDAFRSCCEGLDPVFHLDDDEREEAAVKLRVLTTLANGSPAGARDPRFGLPRLQLIAQAVTPEYPRRKVLAALEQLLREGFLIEWDGLICLEFPHLEETLQTWIGIDSPP